MSVFTRFLKQNRHEIKLFDLDSARAKIISEKHDVQASNSLSQAVTEAEVVILCTPIKNTPQTIQDAANLMKLGAVLCEISSIKSKTAPSLKIAMQKNGVKPLSIHPMFGPDIDSLEKKNIVLTPILNAEEESGLVKLLFPNTNIIISETETHDACMASVLSLPYFMNLIFAKTLPLESLTLLRQLSGPTFMIQMALTQSIIAESPELTKSLINENSYAVDLMKKFIDESRHVQRILKNNPDKFEQLCINLQNIMEKDPESCFAREKRFEIIK